MAKKEEPLCALTSDPFRMRFDSGDWITRGAAAPLAGLGLSRVSRSTGAPYRSALILVGRLGNHRVLELLQPAIDTLIIQVDSSMYFLRFKKVGTLYHNLR